MLDHIKSGADFMTTCLTTFRTGLPGDSSTRWTSYQFFRTKKHVLDAISRKKLHPFAWGGRGRKFKSCHSDQKSGFERIPIFLCLLSFWGLFGTYSERSFFRPCYAVLGEVLRNLLRRVILYLDFHYFVIC